MALNMIQNDETEPELHCGTEALSLRAPFMEVAAAASNSHDGLRIEVLEKETVATQNVLEQALAAMQKVLSAQDHEISILVKQVGFLRQGFQSNSSMFNPGYYDATALYDWPGPTGSQRYQRVFHLCILESKSRIIKSQMVGKRVANGSAYFYLIQLKNIPMKAPEFTLPDFRVYDVFIEYFYQASLPTSALETYWTWLLFLGSEYEVHALKEDCEQYFKSNVDISRVNIVEILELGFTCGSRVLVRCAIDADARGNLLNLTEEPCRKLVETYPQVRNLISQAANFHMGRRFAQQQPSL